MLAGNIQEPEEDVPTLAFSTVCSRLGLIEEDQVTDAYNQIKTVLNVYTRYLGNYIKYLKNRDNQTFHLKAISDVNLELKVGGNRIWKVIPETVIHLGADENEWYVCDDDGEGLQNRDVINTYPDRTGVRILDEDNFKSESGMYWFRFPELRELGSISIFGKEKKVRSASFNIQERSKLYVDGRLADYKVNDDGTISIFSRISNSTITIDGSAVGYKIEKMSHCPDGALPYNDGYLLQSADRPGGRSEDVTDEFLNSCFTSDLIIEGKTIESMGFDKISYNRFSSSESLISRNGTITHTVFSNLRIPYVTKQSVSNRYRIDYDEEYKSESGREPWDPVFEDNILLYCGKKKIEPIRKNKDSMELLLKWEDAKELGNEFDLTVKYDMRDPKQQLRALTRIKNKPSMDYAPLYNLFLQSKGKGNWGQFESLDETDWYVLDDSTYEGCQQQRDFVKCAVSTTDFTILDGPPGTGKTTAIRELIIKLIMSGKRVLVASSTNAAIDNVLEWLIEKDCEKNPEFKEKLFPVRLGLEDKTSDRVKEYSMERLLKRFECSGLEENEIERLILESSNLVCGTISKVYSSMSPRIEEEDRWKEKIAYVPPFDYLIMDESSKTTFQEFIVPALYAKRWILAGDIKQLSPFTDEGAASNLLNLFSGWDSNFKIGQSDKTAINYINAFSRKDWRPKNVSRCVVIVQPELWLSLENQIATMEQTTTAPKGRGVHNRVLVTNGQYCYNPHKPDYERIFDSEVLYVRNFDFVNARYFLGDNTYVIDLSGLKINTLPENNHLRHKKYDLENVNLESLMKNINDSWEDQIRWRLERDYWLRNSKGRNPYISQIYGFIPGAIYSDESKRKQFMTKVVYAVQNVLYHSILELLTVQPTNEDRRNLLQSFNEDELACRKVSLIYQHRMDPGISRTPSVEFYDNNLLDGSNVMNRQWGYYIEGADQCHSVWIQCATEEKKSVNLGEIELIMSELRKFIAWAESNPKPDGKKYEVILLTFYQGQKMKMKERVDLMKKSDAVYVKVATVDYIQGQEADIVFLSMVRRNRIGFMDTPNRLNVAITRARNLMVFIGDSSLFKDRRRSAPELEKIVEGCVYVCRDQVE